MIVIRVAMMYSGLRPISEFDSVRIHEMAQNPDSASDDLWHAEDNGLPPTAYSVMLHYRAGGIDSVRDFHFDPTDPGSAAAAKEAANELAISLGDMLLAFDEAQSTERGCDKELTLAFVWGSELAADPRTSQIGL